MLGSHFLVSKLLIAFRINFLKHTLTLAIHYCDMNRV